MATPNRVPGRIPLQGSERKPMTAANAVGPADPNERILVTVRLRRQTPLDESAMLQPGSLQESMSRPRMNREEYAARHGASAEDISRIEQFAHQNALTVVEVSAARRTVVLAGSVAQMSDAFGVTLRQYAHPNGTYRGREGAVQIPEDLSGVIEGVFGLDNRPIAHPHIRRAASIHAMAASFTPPQVASLYDFPSGSDGAGECIALIELNTPYGNSGQPGCGYRPKDLARYFHQLGIAEPTVTAVSVDGGQNLPMVNPDADGEVMLDIEVAGSTAPGAAVAVYFAPNTDQGFLDAITSAIHDTTRKPSVISISWGGPEIDWTQQAITAFDQAFQTAAALGVTVCAAAGDNGSSDMAPGTPGDDGKAHVDFPASDPYVLACGGTRLQAAGRQITAEQVWNDGLDGGAGGGGISDVFPLPAYQDNARVPPSANMGKHIGRGVPDVSGDADPQSGYQVLVDGKAMVIGGTSAVAPLWAGLIARLNQAYGKSVGFLNPALYALPAGNTAFHDVTAGNNGAYSAGPGWDACTGLGTPDGAALETALGAGQPTAVVGAAPMPAKEKVVAVI